MGYLEYYFQQERICKLENEVAVLKKENELLKGAGKLYVMDSKKREEIKCIISEEDLKS